MPMETSSSMLMVAFLALLAGLAIGLVIAWLTFPRARRMRETRQELDQTRHEFDEFRHQVNGHFAQTSSLFREMTEKYREVYDHLSEGARELCTRELPKEALDQAERKLPLAAPLTGGGNHHGAHDDESRRSSDAPVAAGESAKTGTPGSAADGDGTGSDEAGDADASVTKQAATGEEAVTAAGEKRRDQAASR